MRLFVICAVVVFLCAGGAEAEIIEKTDGSRIEARIVGETAEALTIETNEGGISVRQRLPRKQIKSIRKVVQDGPGYCIVPLEGSIGREVTAEGLREALLEARKLKASIIILAINSDGGLVEERDRIIGVIRDNNDLEFVAYITKAMSAASTISMTCPTIIMAPEAAIGAAVVYRITPDGSPKLLEEKFQSFMRAADRAACALGGHDELWAYAMREGDLELAVVRDSEGKASLQEIRRGAELPEGATVIKRRGKILTLTAKEAVEWGLAKGEATTMGDIRRVLGHATWHNAGSAPGSVMANKALAARVKHDKEQQRAENQDRLARQVKGMDAQMARLMEKVNAAEEEYRRIKDEAEARVAEINREYDEEMTFAKSSGSASRAAKAGNTARQKLSAARKQYDPLLTAARDNHSNLVDQFNRMLEERTKIAATAGDE